MNVADCSVSPRRVRLGDTSTLTVVLDQAAPQGGITVTINTIFDGSSQTLVHTPTHLLFTHGNTVATFALQTQRVNGASTRIIFTATVPGGIGKSSQLDIS
jgi:hypothetical protein